MLDALKKKLQDWRTKILSFFAYSHTILVARITMLTGFLTAVIGGLDWAPLLGLNIDTGFSKNQVVWLGIVTFVKGVLDEIARRTKGVMKPDL